MKRSYFGEDVVVMPKPRFIQEHRNLIKVLGTADPEQLKKEAAEQKKELAKYEKGGSKQSGFIQRMMAEVKLKHDGEYKTPTKPLSRDSTMKAPVAFDYFKMPKQSREKSKFIMSHFLPTRAYNKGEREMLNEAELKIVRDAEAERQRRSRAKRKAKKEE